jgi:hypothetical protein
MVACCGALAALWLGGCGASTAGANPHDMSAERHLAAASQEEEAAAAHAAQHDPAASGADQRCRSAARGTICWTSLAKPTEQHLRDAEEHRRRAADHRAAAQALTDAEVASCEGVTPEDRDISPFYHREDVRRVEPLHEKVYGGSTPGLKGAIVSFRAVPGLTTEWLQRLVRCHVARSASMGHAMPGMSYCPLALKGVTASVTSAGDGFAVTIQAEDPDTAAEVLRRAQALVPR